MKRFLALFKRIFTLPGPVELGMSDRNALGMKSITPFQKGPTWEEWREIVKKNHAFKYFLIEVLWRKQFRPFFQRFEDAAYWIKCHTVSRHHFLDLRNVDPANKYEYGYLLPSTIIQFAMWKGLRIYIEGNLREDPRQMGFTEEEMQEQWYVDMLFAYDESKAIYHYLTVERVNDEKQDDEFYLQQRSAIKNNNEAAYRILNKEIVDRFLRSEEKEREMLVRLAKIVHLLY